MKQKNKILLLSTFAKDTLLNQEGKVLRVQKGGPALYILSAFNEDKIAFEMPYKPNLDVEILITDKGEFGRIKQKSATILISWSTIEEPSVFISGILNEFDLANIENYKGQIFLDAQGYVRSGSNFGKKKFWRNIPDNITCIKGTAEEIRYLPKDIVERQKQKALLITSGSKGSVLYFKGNKTIAKPSKNIKSTNTIGAGDTFFAYFIAQLLKSSDPKESLEYATLKTTSFLYSKFHHHTNLL